MPVQDRAGFETRLRARRDSLARIKPHLAQVEANDRDRSGGACPGGRPGPLPIIEADDAYGVILIMVGTAVAAAVLGLIYLGGRLSDGSRSSLLVIALTGAYPWPKAILEGLKFRLLSYFFGDGNRPIADYSCFVAFFAVENAILALIGVAALADAIRGRLRGDTMPLIGLMLVAIDLVVVRRPSRPRSCGSERP